MPDEPQVHRLLLRQLRRLQLDPRRSLTPQDLQRFLSTVSQTYQEADDDRYLLERSLEVSSTEMRGLHDSLSRKVLTDELSGLPNRRALQEGLGPLVAAGARDRLPVAVLFIDLDGFKLVNDSLGHEAGDELLVLTAQRLRAVGRAGDVVARLGGDEFVVAGTFADVDAARTLAERILQAVETPLVVAGREVTVSASIGLAFGAAADSATELDPDVVLQQADLAMYASKRSGRARITLFDARMQADVERRMQIVTQLRSGIAQDQLHLHYQPIVHLGRRAVIGAEALVRWQPPGSPPLVPAEFVPIAEEYRLVGDLDAWVLRQACRRAVGWPLGPGGISVNMSVRTFDSLDVAELVRRTLSETGLPAGHLVIELTEQAYGHEGPAVAANLAAVRALGVRLAMDDFGVGQSGLARLRTLPVQVLKLHGSLTESVDQYENSASIVGAVVTLGHALGHLVVAEGVERRSQAEVLRAVGCDAAQGRLFGLPADPEVLDTRLSTGRGARPPVVRP